MFAFQADARRCGEGGRPVKGISRLKPQPPLLCGLSGAPSFKPPDWSGAILVLAMVLVVPLFMLVPEMGARLLRPNETRRERVVSRATGRTGLAGHSTTSPSE